MFNYCWCGFNQSNFILVACSLAYMANFKGQSFDMEGGICVQCQDIMLKSSVGKENQVYVLTCRIYI